MVNLLQIESVPTCELPRHVRAEILAVCHAAYQQDLAAYLENIGPGVHLLGRIGGTLVSHAIFVERWLEVTGGPRLRTAYVELVATRPTEQRRGYAGALLRRLAREIEEFDIGGLSPSNEKFYAGLGWETWRGPRYVRTGTALEPCPDEDLMVLRLPRTPPGLSLDEPVSIEWRPGEVW